ncbi:hypothetical protein HN958_04865 [Candidatus Falkowbacteria bacterium]|nr:hypothetical protein [Candidatus Falkowbacteria bacterium]
MEDVTISALEQGDVLRMIKSDKLSFDRINQFIRACNGEDDSTLWLAVAEHLVRTISDVEKLLDVGIFFDNQLVWGVVSRHLEKNQP